MTDRSFRQRVRRHTGDLLLGLTGGVASVADTFPVFADQIRVWRPDQNVTLSGSPAVDEGNVDSWEDTENGVSLLQGTSGNQPKLETAGSQPALKTDASDDFMYVAETPVSSGPWTIAGLFNITSTTLNQDALFGLGTTDAGYVFVAPNAGVVRLFSKNLTGGTGTTSITLGLHLVEISYDGSNMNVYLDGVYEASLSSSPGFTLTVGVNLFCSRNGSNVDQNGYHCHFLVVCDDEWTSGERAQGLADTETWIGESL